MDVFFTIASAVAALLVVGVIVQLGRGGDAMAARAVLPAAIVVLIGQMAFGHWSLPAFALLAAVIVSAGALAVRGPGREHGRTWAALAVFAGAGLVGGYGLLANALCRAGDTYNCASTGPDALAIAGWAIAFAAYAYLAWGALRP